MHSLLRSTPSATSAGDALGRLACIGAELGALGNRALSADECLHEVSAVVHSLIAELIRAEREGHSREDIAEALVEARAVHRTSPFIRHCQDWPRGYPGDFEMIGWLLNPHARASAGTVGYALEHMALHCLPAQQHRNKVRYQTDLVTRTLRERPDPPRILSVGCGGAHDVVDALQHWSAPVHVVLNDLDAGATAHAAAALGAVTCDTDVRVLTENALVAARRLVRESAQFDLILVGGLCDYLENRTIVRLTTMLLSTLPAGGTLYFSNMAPGNPYRLWMDYFFEWRLIERSELELRTLVVEAGAPADCISIQRDETNLACLVQMTT